MNPTEQQKAILECRENLVVIAAPGSGKTFVLSEKIKNDIKELLDYQGIIAISYTNKASLELKNRHKTQRKAKFYLNNWRSVFCM